MIARSPRSRRPLSQWTPIVSSRFAWRLVGSALALLVGIAVALPARAQTDLTPKIVVTVNGVAVEGDTIRMLNGSSYLPYATDHTGSPIPLIVVTQWGESEHLGEPVVFPNNMRPLTLTYKAVDSANNVAFRTVTLSTYSLPASPRELAFVPVATSGTELELTWSPPTDWTSNTSTACSWPTPQMTPISTSRSFQRARRACSSTGCLTRRSP